MKNILSIDVEEYFHPSEVQRSFPIEKWPTFSSRVEDSTNRILDLLDNHSTLATFFILGWVAERKPALVRRIADRGHEIACHSYAHQLIYSLTPEQFREDTQRAVAAIASAAGISPTLYRAPSFSVTNQSLWALEILIECGFRYDSSIFPIAHDRYGIPGFNRHAQILKTPSGPIFEVPVATTELSGAIVPVGGGAYMRLLPYRYMAAGIRRVNRKEDSPACIYFHPWEIDVDQPRIAEGFISKMRTYTGVAGMTKKLDRLVADFQFAPMSAVYPDPFRSELETTRQTNAPLAG